MYGPTRISNFSPGELHVALLRSVRENLLSLFKRLRVPESVAVGCAHVVHTYGSDGFHARVDFCSADDKTPATANPEDTNPLPVHECLAAQEINRSAEILSINISRNGVLRLTLPLAPKRRIEGQRAKSLIGQFLGV